MELPHYHRSRILLFSALLVCFCLFWFGAAWFGIPAHRGFEADLLLQPSPVASLLIVGAMYVIAVVIGTVVAGTVRFNAGLATAAAGLAALSYRGGTSRASIMRALGNIGPSGLYLRQLVETILLLLLCGGCWWVLRNLYNRGTLKDREPDPANPNRAKTENAAEWRMPGPATLQDHSGGEVSAIGVQFLITAALTLLIAQTENKGQVQAAILAAAFAGSAITHTLYSTGPRGLYWLPPLAVGAIGYLIALISPPTGTETANIHGFFAPLVRLLPLDYASAGTLGAVWGHWMSRKWERERKAMEAAASAGSAA